MKTKSIILAATLLASMAAQARKEKLYLIDLTGKNFQTQTFNMMDDGISGDFDAFGIKLDGEISKNFSVKIDGSEKHVQCQLVVFQKSPTQTILKLVTNIETDSGETCEMQVVYQNGKKATLSIYEEGT